MISVRPLVLLLILCLLPQFADAARRPSASHELQERIKAAKNGDAATQYALGLDFRGGNTMPKDPVQAYKWIRLAAVNNLAEAQYTAGLMDQSGEGTPRKWSDAAEWFRKASKQGHLAATLALADMLRYGEGVPIDLAGAARLYRAAADRNDLKSQLILGELYAKGEGVTKNLNDASIWYRRAAQLGSAEGRYRLALLLLDGDPARRSGHRPSRNSREALFWLQLASEQSYAPAQFALGMTCWGGITQRFDGIQAFSLILQAGDQGYVPALRKLAGFYRKGKVVAKDPSRAFMYLELADQLSDIAGGIGRDGGRDELLRDLSAAQQQAAKKRAQEWLQLRGL